MDHDAGTAMEAASSSEKAQSEIQEILKLQDRRRLSSFHVEKLEKDAKKNWDIFYKTNTTNFFKDRHWTLREFSEILDIPESNSSSLSDQSDLKPPILLEAGCGVGNFAFPIISEVPALFVYACDFSPRAVDFVKSNPEYKENRICAFTCDLTAENCFAGIKRLMSEKADFASLIFVLSAISPDKHSQVAQNLVSAMKSGGILFFRDYGRHDVAQLRFKAGKKIAENFYVRRDGTRSYYFTPEEVISLFTQNNQFTCIQCDYVTRRTVNVKEQVDIERIFVQGKFLKV